MAIVRCTCGQKFEIPDIQFVKKCLVSKGNIILLCSRDEDCDKCLINIEDLVRNIP